MSEEIRQRIIEKINTQRHASPGYHPWEADAVKNYQQYPPERQNRVKDIQVMLCRTEPEKYYTPQEAFVAAYGQERLEYERKAS